MSANDLAPSPAAIVADFLDALDAADLDRAAALLHEDAVWINLKLPAVRGRQRIDRLNRFLVERAGMRVRIHNHAIVSEGNVVLTDRTDALRIGRFEQIFWVFGRFEIRDGLILVWRDAFDWADIVISLARAAAGAVVPALNRPFPGRAPGNDSAVR